MKRHFYGSCHRCSHGFTIPGADHNFCLNCNDWIPDPTWLKTEVEATAVKVKPKLGRKKTQSESMAMEVAS